MIICFPQLATGTSGQFPITRTPSRRTIVNRLGDGREIRLADPDASTVQWDLQYRGLSDSERVSLVSFFEEMRGRLRTFLFLDPCGNLLAHSEDLTRPVWSLGGMIRVEAQEGYTRLVNTAQTAQGAAQEVEAPGWYRYCGSGVFRCSENTAIQLTLGTADGAIASSHKVSAEWTEASCSGSIDGSAEAVTFGIEMPAGIALDIRGLQLEAQPGRSGYHRTTGSTGCYPETRFDQDELVFQADGIENHSTSIRLVSRARL
ncbi:MAG: DUF2460 domain-containing protein [Bryobacteraceae bacterium]|nr:DUF2460 domain-containing protein [Bryobacteraceae bacterium]